VTYDFRRENEFCFEHETQACLAIVDLDTYPPSPPRASTASTCCAISASRMEALTAAMWETPDDRLRLRLLIAYDYRAVEELRNAGHHVFADGWVRPAGGSASRATRRCLIPPVIADGTFSPGAACPRPARRGCSWSRPAFTRSPYSPASRAGRPRLHRRPAPLSAAAAASPAGAARRIFSPAGVAS